MSFPECVMMCESLQMLELDFNEVRFPCIYNMQIAYAFTV